MYLCANFPQNSFDFAWIRKTGGNLSLLIEIFAMINLRGVSRKLRVMT
jgi:hypothetical protein